MLSLGTEPVDALPDHTGTVRLASERSPRVGWITGLRNRKWYPPPGCRPSRSVRAGSLTCSLSCSSPASSTVHGGTRRAVTCIGRRWWTCGNAGQRTLDPRVAQTIQWSGRELGVLEGHYGCPDTGERRAPVVALS